VAHLLRSIFTILFALLSERKVEGLENLPAQGPYIVAANHLSIFDTPFLYGLIGGKNVTGWAGEKYARHPLFGLLVRLGGGIFIRRGEVDRDALAAAVDWLRQGKIFGMAPEGTRSKTGALIRAKVGVAYLAHAVDVPIVPAAITGTEKLGRTLLRFRRAKLTLRFGRPFHLPPLDPEKRAMELRTHTDEIMCRIAAMLPAQYRGVYADHPRLKQLLQEGD
jgi:1-acyl-sn-glycerol-3-phosphate acyltransferase